MSKTLRNVLPALALALAPVGLAAQDPAAGGSMQLPAEAQEVVQEMQQIQAQLGPIQQQALADPALRSEGEALGTRIEAAMAAIDPATSERISRLETLMTEAQAARAEQDEARFEEIATEAQAIEQSLQAVQNQALERPEVAVEVEAFQASLISKMNEVDPNAGQLFARLEELNERLATILGIES